MPFPEEKTRIPFSTRKLEN